MEPAMTLDKSNKMGGSGLASSAAMCMMVLLASLVSSTPKAMAVQEHCLADTVQVKCKQTEVIVVESAHYGRMRMGRCVTRNYGHMGCSKPVIGEIDALCSGRKECKFDVSVLLKNNPCPVDLSSYLELSYKCQKVTALSSRECRLKGRTSIADASGYLSGWSRGDDADGNNRPASSCTYQITVQPGQKINITLLDFSTASWNTTSSSGHGASGGATQMRPTPRLCHQYAMISERGMQYAVTGCSDSDRETRVYTSHGPSVSVRVIEGNDPNRNFLLKYQAVGCPSFTVPEAAHVKYDGDNAVVHCNYTTESFAVTCQDTHWRGIIGNCSVRAPSLEYKATSGNFLGLPPVGVSLVIIFGVALVIVVYVGVMIVCVLYVKRKRRRRQELQQNREFMHWSTPGPPGEDKVPLSAMKGPDERLPMLVKQFRSANGDYSDVCELQDVKPFTDQTGTYSVGRFTRSGSRGSTTSSTCIGTGSGSPGVASNTGCVRTLPGNCGKLLRKSGKLAVDAKVRPNTSGAVPFYFDVDGESYSVRTDHPHGVTRQATNPDLVPGNHGGAPLDSTFFTHCSNPEGDYGCAHRRDCTL